MSATAAGKGRIGLAILVKTPGHSPLKTRLAEGIRRSAAEDFHRLAAASVAAVARAAQAELPGLAVSWAVAEDAALDDVLWSGLPCIAQRAGDLGARMRHVTEHLCRAHGGALLLGADTPQLCVDDLVAAVRALDVHDHVLGPSTDGGFWLFGTRMAVPAAAWADTPWSRPDTAARFAAALGTPRIARLRELRDADAADDLPPLLAALDALPAPLPEQTHLAEWLRRARPS
jgi:rSAM/selenodomain-associated transferase 1